MKDLVLVTCLVAMPLSSAIAEESSRSLASTLETYVFPAAGQAADQQSKDEAECYSWAVSNTGTDPFELQKQDEAVTAQAEQQAAAAEAASHQATQDRLIISRRRSASALKRTNTWSSFDVYRQRLYRPLTGFSVFANHTMTMGNAITKNNETWPPLPFEQAGPTWETLHLWTQIVGKVRLALTPWQPYSWHATLYVTAHGLSTSAIAIDQRTFEIEFDFMAHVLNIRVSDGNNRSIDLKVQSVATFYAELMRALNDLGIEVSIHDRPNEVADPIPFAEDDVHASYEADHAEQLWRAMLQIDRVLKIFRTGFLGKSSPVHFFWGSFDLAVTRFSGRPAPRHPGGIPNLPDRVTREAYSHEVSSAGFWPGGGPTDYAAFYSYAYPVPDGFAEHSVKPAAAFYSQEAGEFILPYEAVRTADDPDATLLEFLTSTYEAAATTAWWDRSALECRIGEPRVVRPL